MLNDGCACGRFDDVASIVRLGVGEMLFALHIADQAEMFGKLRVGE